MSVILHLKLDLNIYMVSTTGNLQLLSKKFKIYYLSQKLYKSVLCSVWEKDLFIHVIYFVGDVLCEQCGPADKAILLVWTGVGPLAIQGHGR